MGTCMLEEELNKFALNSSEKVPVVSMDHIPLRIGSPLIVTDHQKAMAFFKKVKHVIN